MPVSEREGVSHSSSSLLVLVYMWSDNTSAGPIVTTCITVHSKLSDMLKGNYLALVNVSNIDR